MKFYINIAKLKYTFLFSFILPYKTLYHTELGTGRKHFLLTSNLKEGQDHRKLRPTYLDKGTRWKTSY